MGRGSIGMVAAAAALLATGMAQGQTRPGLEIGAELVDYDYRERLDGQTIVRDEGRLGRLRGSYVETVGGGAFLRMILDGSTGKVDYRADDGTRLDDVDQSVGQLELHIGKDFRVGGATVTAFAGLGQRVLLDESGGLVSTAGTAGYDRTISYAFVPVGIAAGVPLGGARLLLSAQFNRLFHGEAESDLSDVDPAFPDLDLRLRGGHGFALSGIVAIPAGRREIRFGPVLRTWRIARSRARIIEDGGETAVFFEPANRTAEWSLRLALAF